MEPDVVLDLGSLFERLPVQQLSLLRSNVNDPRKLRGSLEMLRAQSTNYNGFYNVYITDRLVNEAVDKPQDTKSILDYVLGK